MWARFHSLSKDGMSKDERDVAFARNTESGCKGEIIQKQAIFSLPFRTPNNSRVVLINIRCLFCFFFRSLFYLAEVIFSSKSRKESLELMFSFKV